MVQKLKLKTKMVKQLILVAIGGGLGSVLRYLTSLGIAKCFPVIIFPLGTFVVNVIGCFIMGLLVGLSTRFAILDNELRFLLIVGFCGGYTTFSAFSLENLKLFEAGNYWALAFYIAASIVLGFIALWSGYLLSKIIVQ